MPTIPLTDAEKTDCRRFMGYEAAGSGAGGTLTGFDGYRFFTAYGTMEFKLTNMDDAEAAVVLNNYLPTLLSMEAAVDAAMANLQAASAGSYVHNKNEIADRSSLFDQKRRALCDFLGVPYGKGLGNGNSRPLIV